MSEAFAPDAAGVIGAAIARCPSAERSRLARELLAHSGAALIVVDGNCEAAEAVYRLADAMVARNNDVPAWRSPPAAPELGWWARLTGRLARR